MNDVELKIYIAGKISGNPNYKEEFAEIERWIKAQYPNVIVLNPAVLPQGMSNADYMKMCFSMMDSADIVIFNHTTDESDGAKLERDYCRYIQKPFTTIFYDGLYIAAPCPECGFNIKIGYACGEHFIISSDTSCPCCDKFNIMRNGEKDEANCWNLYSTMWRAHQLKSPVETTTAEWVDDWLNHPFYKCKNCGYVFVGAARYCESCGRRIVGEESTADEH